MVFRPCEGRCSGDDRPRTARATCSAFAIIAASIDRPTGVPVNALRRTGGSAKRRIKRRLRRMRWRLLSPLMNRYRHWRTDLYFVSYPKAGRTWLRLMVGRALCRRYGLPEGDALKTYRLTGKAGVLRARWTHDGSDILFGRHPTELSPNKRWYRRKVVVLVVRNVKDVLVSSYFQATKRVGSIDGTIADFVRDERFGARKVLMFYKLWFVNRSVPASFHVVRYEDLHRDPHGTLARVLAIVGADGVSDDLLEEAVGYARFERMKDMERNDVLGHAALRASDEDDAESFKVRRGVVRGYPQYLS